MSQTNTSIPFQFKRLYADALDADYSFTTAERATYLATDNNKYEGQIVYDNEEGTLYKVDPGKASYSLLTPEITVDQELNSASDNAVSNSAVTPAVIGDGAATVSLDPGQTFGKLNPGDIFDFTNLTWQEAFTTIMQKPLAPTVTLTSTTTVLFNQTSINNVLNFTYIIKSLGASVATVLLEWRRNNTGVWSSLDTNTSDVTFTHTLTDTNFNTQPFNYRYTVTDTQGAVASATKDITPTAYAAPSISIVQVAAILNGTQTNTSREKGNINTNISGSITRNSINVALQSYQIQYQVNGGAFTNLGSSQSISGASASIPSTSHTDSSLINSNSIAYRVQVTDTFTTTNSSTVSITFLLLSLFGYSANTSLTDPQAYALGNGVLATTRARPAFVASASSTTYTYITYPAAFGNIAQIIQDGATPVLGAFNGGSGVPTTQTVTNQYGVFATYNVYKSNQLLAFTNNSLVIS